MIRLNGRRQPNPFAKDARRPPEGRPKGRTECDALDQAKQRVLKNIYRPAKVPDALDAIIIGSGIGGLTVASLLAKVGKRVLVLEQHDQAGGCCHSFRDHGFKFDPGIHYIGDMHERATLGFLVGQLSEGQLEWAPLDPDYDVILLDQPEGPPRRIPMTAARRCEVLRSHFPSDAATIAKWDKLVHEAVGSITALVMLKSLPRSLARLLAWLPRVCNPFRRAFYFLQTSPQAIAEQLTSDPALQAVFNYCWGDHGVPPARASFAIHAMILSHYERGAYYPVGGSDHIAYTLIPPITRAGGAVLVQARVDHLLVEGGRVAGVQLQSGQVIKAPMVISSVGVHATLTRLLPPPLRPAWPAQYPPSTSFISVFVGLRGSAAELSLPKSQYWCYTRLDVDAAIAAFEKGGPSRALEDGFPVLFISFPSAKEPLEGVRSPDESTCTVLSPAPYAWFQEWQDETTGRRGPDYEQMKEMLGRQMWKQACAYFPQLVDRVQYFAVGTPLTNEHYLACIEGASYGLDHSVPRFSPEGIVQLRSDGAGVPGLWLTGQDTLTCGFGGALMGGFMTASAILGRNLFADLLALKGRCKASAPTPQT